MTDSPAESRSRDSGLRASANPMLFLVGLFGSAPSRARGAVIVAAGPAAAGVEISGVAPVGLVSQRRLPSSPRRLRQVALPSRPAPALPSPTLVRPTIPKSWLPLLLTPSSPRPYRHSRGPRCRPPCCRGHAADVPDIAAGGSRLNQRWNQRRGCRSRRSYFRCQCIRCWSESRYCRLQLPPLEVPAPRPPATLPSARRAAPLGVRLSTAALAGAPVPAAPLPPPMPARPARPLMAPPPKLGMPDRLGRPDINCPAAAAAPP